MAAVKYPRTGTTGLRIIRAAIDGGSYHCDSKGEVSAACGANGHGYLERDPKDGALWYPTDKGRAMLAELEAQAASTTAVAAPQKDMFDLVATVQRAMDLLDAGDVLAAKQLASGVYLDAKARAQFAASFGAAGKRVVAKARQLQGDALLIETRAKMSMAAAWADAKAEGLTHKGRPKSVADDNAFTAEEAGLTRQEIHEARKLLEAEEKEPGIAERAIAARVSAGLEPSRRSLKTAIGTKTATKAERGDNLYETPPEAMHALLALEDFSTTVWEPACGKGAISRMLEAAGYDVALSDLVDYGTVTQDGEVQAVEDFVDTLANPSGLTGCPDIVTNPPYGECLNAFVAHALKVHRPRKMALLLNWNFFCGFDDPDRNFAMDDHPPARAWVFRRRLPMMHRDGWDGPKASSSMNTAWLVWEQNDDGSYGNQTITKRVDWLDYMPAEVKAVASAAAFAAESEAA